MLTFPFHISSVHGYQQQPHTIHITGASLASQQWKIKYWYYLTCCDKTLSLVEWIAQINPSLLLIYCQIVHMANLSSTRAWHQTVLERMRCSIRRGISRTEVLSQQALAAALTTNGCLEWCDSIKFSDVVPVPTDMDADCLTAPQGWKWEPLTRQGDEEDTGHKYSILYI